MHTEFFKFTSLSIHFFHDTLLTTSLSVEERTVLQIKIDYTFVIIFRYSILSDTILLRGYITDISVRAIVLMTLGAIYLERKEGKTDILQMQTNFHKLLNCITVIISSYIRRKKSKNFYKEQLKSECVRGKGISIIINIIIINEKVFHFIIKVDSIQL